MYARTCVYIRIVVSVLVGVIHPLQDGELREGEDEMDEAWLAVSTCRTIVFRTTSTIQDLHYLCMYVCMHVLMFICMYILFI